MLFIGGPLPELTFVDSDTQSVNSSHGATITFSGMSFGGAKSDRYLAVASQHSLTPNSLTIGSVSASRRVLADFANGIFHARCSIWIAKVPSGSSGSVVMQFSSGGAKDVGISIYAITGLAHGGAASDTDTDGSPHDPMSATVTVPNKGVAIAVASIEEASDNPPISWTGLSAVNINSRYNTLDGIGTGFTSGRYTGDGGSRTFSAATRGTRRVASLAAASFR